MKKQLLSVMFCLTALGGTFLNVLPTKATVLQSNVIKTKGQVVDEQGEPLIGVNVTLKGQKTGTVTDFDGKFQLDVPANATLLISYVGYKSREIAVRGRAVIDVIELQPIDNLIDQVVVVGYGTQKKADLTGSVSVVNAEELKKVSNSNISTMLEGKVPGVQITTDGQPGADPMVRIRGIGSFGSTAPLYVVDGVPVGTTIRDFSPNDIASIQVLKDAAAGAVYGSRAANGVIIITTKNGQKDQPLRVDYSGYMGIDKISGGVYDVMDADQYSQYVGQACVNSSTPLPGGYKLNPQTGRYQFMDNTNTAWFNEVFKTGIRQNHNVNLSGGGAHNTYNIALDYFRQQGTLVGAGPNYKRYTANVLRGTLLMQPTIKAYDASTWVLDDRVGLANGYRYDAYGYGVYYDNIHGDISASNPLLVNHLLQRNTLVDRFVGSGSADVDLLKMLGVKSKHHQLHYNLNLSYSKTHAKDFTWISAWAQSNRVYLDKSNERLTKGSRDYTDALIENTISYEGHIGKHNFNALLGQTYEEEHTDLLTGQGINMNEPYFLQLQNSKKQYAESFEFTHALSSFIGRLNYNYDEKYLLSFVVRRDGSSRLTRAIRWGTFPSASIGWRLDKEKFFPISNDVVNLLKLRASYGVLGNENIGEYQYMATMARNNMTYSFNNKPVSGSAVSTFVNQNIAWEKKKTTNIGVDIAMFNNRFEFTAEWYKNRSEDLLYGVPVPEQTGVSNGTVTMNAASMNNSGFEFSATYRNRDHALTYEVGANLSTLKNKVTSLGFGTKYITGAFATFVGQEIGKFYGWEYEGIARTQADLDNHATQQGANIGDCLYKDVSGADGVPDGVIDEHDQVVLGSGLPKLTFGVNVRLEYKHIDLSIATYGALNYHVTDDIYNSLNSCYGWGNKDVAILRANAYTEDGMKYMSNVPRTYVTNNATLPWNDLFSSRKIQNAAYWKIANIELGYNLPNKWFGGVVSGVRAYCSAQNLFTLTKYHGYNVDFAGGTFTPGYNFCSFPSAQSFMFGLHFTF